MFHNYRNKNIITMANCENDANMAPTNTKKDESKTTNTKTDSKGAIKKTNVKPKREFDFEEFIYIKIKNMYVKLSNTSYNTLVAVGSGPRYCVLCSMVVYIPELIKHVESEGHVQKIEKHRFIDKYGDQMIRQTQSPDVYHCGICNLMITPKELKCHLRWPAHILQHTQNGLKKIKKLDIKKSDKKVLVNPQKESSMIEVKEPISVLLKWCKKPSKPYLKQKRHYNKDQ